MILRPYQAKAVVAIEEGWKTYSKQLLVAACGAGKTIMLSNVAAQQSERTLLLAHRSELISQACDKLHRANGIQAAVEKGDRSAIPGKGVIVGSVQSMRRRLAKYPQDAFDLVIVDECHHILSEEYQEVLSHFSGSRVLGVTATPDRSDKRSLGHFFQNVAAEIGILQLISEGHLCPLRATRLPVQLDARALKNHRGEVTIDQASDLITPQLTELARAVAAEAWDRKLVCFLPRRDISERFASALRDQGLDARHVDGASKDRAEKLEWFSKAPPGSALVNPQLLQEGWDEPTVDCICVLRATKSRALYQQMVGRGMRLSPGKDHCLLLDPLWLSGELNLCQPADISAPNPTHKRALQAHLDAGAEILEAESRAKLDVETALAAQLEEAAKNRKAPKGLVDPLAWAVGIHDSDLEEYEPAMPWEEEPPTAAQLKALSQAGIWTERMTRGFAVKLLERLGRRAHLGLATPKQVILLRRLGSPNAETMTKDQAGYYIGQRIGGRS